MKSGERFELKENTIPVVEEIGRHMPGGFLIYRADAPQELINANHTVFDIYGCADLREFRRLTGFVFQGLVHPEDYPAATEAIKDQMGRGGMGCLEYRIIRKDGTVRWVDDFRRYADTEAYGGIFYVYIDGGEDRRL